MFEVLGIEKKPIGPSTCDSVSEALVSSSSASKDLFYALKVNSVLKCNIDGEAFEGVISRLQAAVKDASSLLDFYYSVGSLALIKVIDSRGGHCLTLTLESASSKFCPPVKTNKVTAGSNKAETSSVSIR